MEYILSIDAGTTGVRIILINKKGEIVAKEYAELKQYHPQPNWVEHNPIELIETIKILIEKITQNIIIKNIAAIGITNQRETVVVWDATTGQPIYNAIVWQCRRTASRCEELQQQGYEKQIKQMTGLVLDPYFSATKIEWLLKNIGNCSCKGNILCGTIDSWLVWNLSKEKVHVTDTGNASRTMLCNIHTQKWDDELLKIFNIQKGILPTIKSSSEIYGHMEINRYLIPIAGIAGDQQAALFGQCCFEKGEIKNTYGTGCFALLNTGNIAVSSSKLLTTIAWTIHNETYYALEGSVFIAGAAVQWLRDNLQIIADVKETELMATSLQNNKEVYFVPALTGLGCPYWDPYAKGIIIGLTRATKRSHIARAALESIAYQSKDVIETMEQEANILMKNIKADGGAVHNKFLMQFQADILNKTITVSTVQETTALGVAFLAGLAVGFWKDQEALKRLWKPWKVYTPSIPDKIRKEICSKWDDAVSRCMKWSK